MGKRFKKRFYSACCWTGPASNKDAEDVTCLKNESNDTVLMPQKQQQASVRAKTRSPRMTETESILCQLHEMYDKLNEGLARLNTKVNDLLLMNAEILSRNFVRVEEVGKIGNLHACSAAVKEDTNLWHIDENENYPKEAKVIASNQSTCRRYDDNTDVGAILVMVNDLDDSRTSECTSISIEPTKTQPDIENDDKQSVENFKSKSDTYHEDPNSDFKLMMQKRLNIVRHATPNHDDRPAQTVFALEIEILCETRVQKDKCIAIPDVKKSGLNGREKVKETAISLSNKMMNYEATAFTNSLVKSLKKICEDVCKDMGIEDDDFAKLKMVYNYENAKEKTGDGNFVEKATFKEVEVGDGDGILLDAEYNNLLSVTNLCEPIVCNSVVSQKQLCEDVCNTLENEATATTDRFENETTETDPFLGEEEHNKLIDVFQEAESSCCEHVLVDNGFDIYPSLTKLRKELIDVLEAAFGNDVDDLDIDILWKNEGQNESFEKAPNDSSFLHEVPADNLKMAKIEYDDIVDKGVHKVYTVPFVSNPCREITDNFSYHNTENTSIKSNKTLHDENTMTIEKYADSEEDQRYHTSIGNEVTSEEALDYGSANKNVDATVIKKVSDIATIQRDPVFNSTAYLKTMCAIEYDEIKGAENGCQAKKKCDDFSMRADDSVVFVDTVGDRKIADSMNMKKALEDIISKKEENAQSPIPDTTTNTQLATPDRNNIDIILPQKSNCVTLRLVRPMITLFNAVINEETPLTDQTKLQPMDGFELKNEDLKAWNGSKRKHARARKKKKKPTDGCFDEAVKRDDAGRTELKHSDNKLKIISQKDAKVAASAPVPFHIKLCQTVLDDGQVPNQAEPKLEYELGLVNEESRGKNAATKRPKSRKKKNDLADGHFGDGNKAGDGAKNRDGPAALKPTDLSTGDIEELSKSITFISDITAIYSTYDCEYRFVAKLEAARNLQDLMEKGLLCDEDQAKFICFNILDILRFLQSSGVIHTDIYPRKVVLNQRGYPCLTGFENATVRGKTLQENRPVPRILAEYTSPEQLLKGHVTDATDIFSTGVLGIHLIYGRPPHKAVTRRQTKENILNENFIPKFEPDGLLSKTGKRFLVSCIRKDIGKRFSLKSCGPSLVESIEWFNDYDIDQLRNSTFPSPFLPILME